MTRDWKPGDLAMVVCSDGVERRAICRDRGGLWWALANGRRRLVSDSVARPLVVIDPENREQVTRLASHLGFYRYEGTAGQLASSLREFANPKPPACTEEPRDLAARIVDRDGDVWARADNRWGCLTTQSAPQCWQDLVNACGPLHEVTP